MSSDTPFVGDLYDVLGVQRDASADEIKKAFRKLARECHPDVAGDDPDAAKRFNTVRSAYETLVDPIRRARYDRRGQPRPSRWGPDGFRMPGGFHFRTGRERSGRTTARSSGRANTLDLEDIFNDFAGGDAVGDFGFGGRKGRGPKVSRQPGRDISMTVDVPGNTALRGGVVTLNYPRLRRGGDGHSLHRYDEIHDLRVPPGTLHGSSLRVPGMGDAGNDGTKDGDLVCDIRVVPESTGTRQARAGAAGAPGASGSGSDPWARRRASERQASAAGPTAPQSPPPGAVRLDGRQVDGRPSARAWRAAHPSASTGQGSSTRQRSSTGQGSSSPGRSAGRAPARDGDEVVVVPITIGEAVLGGRITVDTPGGSVRMTVPAGSSSGTRLRLRGKGTAGGNLFVELHVAVPRNLDDDSRMLIEEFMQLNPYDPRDVGST